MLLTLGRGLAPAGKGRGAATASPQLTDVIPGLTANWAPYYAGSLAEAVIDTTGNGHDLTPTGTAPALATINGAAPGFALNGVDNALYCNSLAPLLNGDDTPFSIAYLMNRAVAGAYHGHFAAWKESNPTGYRHDVISMNTDAIRVARASQPTIQQPSTAPGFYETGLALFIWNFTGTTVTGYLDGAAIPGIDSADINTQSMGSNLDRLAFGAFTSGSASLSGQMALLCSKVGGVLSEIDRSELKDFIDARYLRH